MEGNETFDLAQELGVAEDTSVETEQVAEAPQAEEQVTEQVENTKTERDSYYADMRRKQELERTKAELARLKAENDRASSTLRNFFDGGTLTDLLNQADAQARGVSVDEIRAEQAEKTRVNELQSQLEMYQAKEVDRMMGDDLKEIQAIDPKITSLEDLPESFLALRFNSAHPMSARDAYLTLKSIEAQTKQPKPASTGSMTGTGKSESEFFSSEELDRLTSKDLDDPKIMEKAMRSMARLK